MVVAASATQYQVYAIGRLPKSNLCGSQLCGSKDWSDDVAPLAIILHNSTISKQSRIDHLISQ